MMRPDTLPGALHFAPGISNASIIQLASNIAGKARVLTVLLGNLDLNLLPILIALDDSRSVSGAALAVGLSQPQVSVMLAKLRKFFRDPLFIRTAHTMQPTPRAAALVKAARAILAQIDDKILADASFDPVTMHRPITFALSDAGEMVFLPRLLRALLQVAPQITVRSVSLQAREISEGLESGEIDLAIGYLPDLRKSNFIQQMLFTSGYASLIRADHPIKSSRLTMKQYMQLDHAVVRATIRSQEVVERFMARRRIKRRIRLIIPHATSLPIIIGQSDLIVTVPRPLADYFSGLNANLRIVDVPMQLPTIELHQHWHRRFHDDARNKWLRTLVAVVLHPDGAPAAVSRPRRAPRSGATKKR